MPSRINMGPDGGPYIAINENSGDIELEDNAGNVVAEWDDTNGRWDFQNNQVVNSNTPEVEIGPDGGPFVSINENNGDIELKDNAGTVVAFWDESATQWDFVSNDLTGVGALDVEELNTGRSWQDVTSSRSFDTQETNSTNSEIKAVVVAEPTADATRMNVSGTVNGQTALGGKNDDTRDSGQDMSIYFTSIPPGATYEVNAFGDTANYELIFWGEFR